MRRTAAGPLLSGVCGALTVLALLTACEPEKTDRDPRPVMETYEKKESEK